MLACSMRWENTSIFLDADDYVLENTLGLLAVHAHGEDIVYGAISNTWNNKANYLEKIANQEIDPEDLEEKQRLHEEKVDAYRLKNPDESEHRLQSVYYLLRVKKGNSQYYGFRYFI